MPGVEPPVRRLPLLHESPEHPWTVDELARRLSVSNATLAARFRGTVGRSPIAYLNRVADVARERVPL
ncbi:regulatory helix-turn-helix AraC family protein [Glaciihabitans tibetensis]|uniref:Regulatory helix-turn-helix AraC family protein n=1 Tax=Glaciihabitans tibetensis TaxID=1266600 RepID=A0A2T0VAH5_9MICO|nr:regulatory helix-turn-helix AraC family protein [Glaciihabitans tibetensis]